MRKFLLVFDDRSFTVAEGKNMLEAIFQHVMEMSWARAMMPKLLCAISLDPQKPDDKELAEKVLESLGKYAGIRAFTL